MVVPVGRGVDDDVDDDETGLELGDPLGVEAEHAVSASANPTVIREAVTILKEVMPLSDHQPKVNEYAETPFGMVTITFPVFADADFSSSYESGVPVTSMVLVTPSAV